MLNGSSVYANFDLSHSYWKLPLENYSQEFQYFITPDSVYSPTRVLQSSINSVEHLQAALATILKAVLTKKLLTWLENILLYEKNTTRLLDTIETSWEYESSTNYNLKIRLGSAGELYP